MIMALSAVPSYAGNTSAGEAAAFVSNQASTAVSVIASDDALSNISATVPLTVTLAVAADGTVTAPTNYAIRNTGVIPDHVKTITALTEEGYSFESDGAKTELALTLTAGDDTVRLAVLPVIGRASAWNIPAGVSLPLSFSGKVGNIKADIAENAKKAFTVNYVIAAGIAE